nr:uncharacterized protein LOC113700749 [Coffea arabica]
MLVWNIRGASRRDSLSYLKKLCFDNKVRLLFLLEPMSAECQLEVVRRYLNFDFSALYIGGEIWVFWSCLLRLSCVEYAEQMLHAHVSFGSGASFWVSAIYAKCTRVGRRPLWEAMESVASSISHNQPWVAAGDFNVIASAAEREWGDPANVQNIDEFNASMFKCGLSTIDFDGSRFTWTNGSVWQRLDRALGNRRWSEAYPLSRVSHMARGRSDHSALLIRCAGYRAASSCFRFLNVWCGHPQFREIVSAAWSTEVSGMGMVRFYNKLKAVRDALKQWNRVVFGNVSSKVAEAEQELKQTEAEYDLVRSEESKILLHEARARYNRALSIECEFWHQKAGIKWLQAGDANTAFFHSWVRQRRNSNFISRIRKEEGGWHEDLQEIKNSAISYFSDLFASNRQVQPLTELPFEVPRVTQEDNEIMKQLPTMKEIHEVVFGMDTQSAPGPDGFGAGFFQSCWDMVKDDLLMAIQDFFQGMEQPRSWSHSMVVLIPKMDGASHWREFRPLSLCNVSSKVVSKILAVRISKLLPKLISPWQTGFVPGRGIVDNVLLAQELILDLDRRLIDPNLILKLDMEKAYDRVDWSFLLFLLRQYGFEEVVVDLLFRTFSNTWFSILVNGEPTGFVKSYQGVRQGDPLSPALFLFVADFLGRGLQRLFDSKDSRYFVSAGSKVSYLAFADDMIIFTRCSQDALVSLKDFLQLYQSCSGQKVNIAKSAFYASAWVTDTQWTLVSTTLGYQCQGFPFKYLGVPLIRGRVTCAAFDALLGKVRQKLYHWSSKMLSMGGKIVLLRSVMCSLPVYLLQVLQPPKAVLLHFGRVCNAFLWDSSIDSKRTHWAAWDKVCRPVEEGGLGFRSFEDITKAFSCKLWWKLRERASIWAEFMHVKYVRGGHPLLVSVDRPSPVWRRLVEVRGFAEGNIRWCLGEGLVDFWQDRWCTDVPLASLVPGPKSHRLVGEFFLSDGWDEQWLRRLLPGHLVSKVMELRIFPNMQDQMIWAASPSGSFTVSSAWDVLRSTHNRSVVDSLVWSSVVPLKVSFLAWRLLRGWLPLDDLLQGRGLRLASKCYCCGLAPETGDHLFVSGPLASRVWRHFSCRFGLVVQGSGVASRLSCWLLSHRFVSQNHIRVILPLLILWFIWKGRNKARFEGVSMSSDQVIDQVCAFVEQLGRGGLLKFEFFKGDTDCDWVKLGKVKGKLVQLRAFPWAKPTGQAVKLNTDASVVRGRSSGGRVVRSAEGNLVFAFYKEFGEKDVLSSEALALLEGLRYCQDSNLTGVIAEVDSSTLVHLVSSKMTSCWPLCNTIRHIRSLVAKLGVSLVHTFREANAVADALASSDLRAEARFLSEIALPSKVRTLLQLDRLSTPYVRVYAKGTSGGLALLWKKDLDISLNRFANSFINRNVHMPNYTRRLTGFYGHPDASKRKYSWDSLRQLSNQSQLSWLCIGDYNEVLSQNEFQDNILIAYGVNHSFKSKSVDKEGSMSIKLDMSKVFDRVEWPFLKGMMLALDFHPSFIDLISSCFSTVSYSFRLNGVQFGYLQPQQGIRQADPISPFLFLICTEAFSSLLQEAEACGKLLGVRI